MRILLLSDLHGHTDLLPKITEELRAADVLCVAGDLTDFGGLKEVADVVEALRAYGKPVHAVLGNCDRPNTGTALIEAGACLEYEGAEAEEGLFMIGCGGGLAVDGATPNERLEDDLIDCLESAWERLRAAGSVEDELITETGAAQATGSATTPVLVVCHTPPYGCGADRRTSGIHGGSAMVRDFVERRRPLAFLCGHVHEAASVDALGPTLVVNPGPFMEGRYAILDLERKDGLWTAEAELRTIS